MDTARKEVYVADGYLNGRVVKFNAATGAFIKAWGAYGSPPSDMAPPLQPSDPNGPYSPQPPDPKSPTFNRPVHCVSLMQQRKRGYLTYNEVNDLVPHDVHSP